MSKGPARSRVRVFLVDDHPIVRRGIQLLVNLEADLMVCGEADDGPAALERIAALKPDLVIVDLTLKTSSGMELIKQLRLDAPRLKILVLSMHDESFYAERVIRAGANGYITKEEGTEKVIGAIRQLMRGQLYLSEKVAAKMVGQVLGVGLPTAGTSVESLSDRELEVFELLGKGLGSREIAERLRLSVKTIESHREHIKDKLGLRRASELVKHAFNWVQGKQSSGPAAPAPSPDGPPRGGAAVKGISRATARRTTKMRG